MPEIRLFLVLIAVLVSGCVGLDPTGRSAVAIEILQGDGTPSIGHPHRYWSSFIDRDSAPVYMALLQPALMIFGELDDSVPIESANALDQRFRQAGKTNFEFVTVAGADHVLKDGPIDKKPEVMARVASFLLRDTECGSRARD
jgi:fermentation-respiration switch protein FrsA (DUF1100 family)